MKIITVVGARPQFIKAKALSRVIDEQYSSQIEEKIIHTGQHFDYNMSKVFFDDLEIPKPHYHFSISGGNHGAMTGKMLEAIENVLIEEKPNWLLVYGDTNSTLAGALAASKLNIPVAHVEAGLRSFNMKMPEEINRIVSDRIASELFCPTKTAIDNLAAEGIINNVHNVGDIMYDAALYYKNIAKDKSKILKQLKLVRKTYALATCHRAENTDNLFRIKETLIALNDTAKKMPVIFPLHPRTNKFIKKFNLDHFLEKLIVTPPLPFLDMLALEQGALIIITDSGGVQKEAFFFGIPCITIRDETEWLETVELGWNKLTGANSERVSNAVDKYIEQNISSLSSLQPYGDGKAANKILKQLLSR